MFAPRGVAAVGRGRIRRMSERSDGALKLNERAVLSVTVRNMKWVPCAVQGWSKRGKGRT